VEVGSNAGVGRAVGVGTITEVASAGDSLGLPVSGLPEGRPQLMQAMSMAMAVRPIKPRMTIGFAQLAIQSPISSELTRPMAYNPLL